MNSLVIWLKFEGEFLEIICQFYEYPSLQGEKILERGKKEHTKLNDMLYDCCSLIILCLIWCLNLILSCTVISLLCTELLHYAMTSWVRFVFLFNQKLIYVIVVVAHHEVLVLCRKHFSTCYCGITSITTCMIRQRSWGQRHPVLKLIQISRQLLFAFTFILGTPICMEYVQFFRGCVW